MYLNVIQIKNKQSDNGTKHGKLKPHNWHAVQMKVNVGKKFLKIHTLQEPL